MPTENVEAVGVLQGPGDNGRKVAGVHAPRHKAGRLDHPHRPMQLEAGLHDVLRKHVSVYQREFVMFKAGVALLERHTKEAAFAEDIIKQ